MSGPGVALRPVRLRCPVGCSGGVFSRFFGGTRVFAFGRGTHTLRLPVMLGKRRSVRLDLDVSVGNGRSVGETIRVRR